MTLKNNQFLTKKSRIALFIFLFTFLNFPLLGFDKREPVKLRVETDKSILTSHKKQKLIVKVTLNSLYKQKKKIASPLNISFVLDKSGSMSGEKIENAKKAVFEAIRNLNRNDIFSVVAYDDNVDTIIPAQNPTYLKDVKEKISAIKTGGNTALFGGLSVAI